jgi:hypothetical protein
MFSKFFSFMGMLGSLRDCGNGMGRATILSMDSQPLTPVVGENVSLWINYDLPAPAITGGTATYSFKINGLPFSPSVEDLCTQTLCPIQAGVHNESSSSVWNGGITGKIISQILWRDQNDALVWCVETTWNV